VIPAAFEYRRPGTLEEAIGLLAGDEDAKVLAGGHSLIPMMRLRLARPSTLVDLGGLRGTLAGIRDEGSAVVVGAMTRHHDVHTSALLRERVPLLAHAAGEVGDPQVRHRGTLGGSLAHADPAADLPAAALALDAVMVVQGPGGRREIPAAGFFTGFFESDLAADEVLVEVRVPVPAAGHGWAYLKFNRRAQDWATVAVAALLERSGDRVQRAAVALAGMGETPLRATATEAALGGGGSEGIAAAAERAAEGTNPVSDLAASADYRRHLARVLTRRALEEALGRAS
jgi:aerobic carbon-monoxide dehydrogenase medium subunit